MILKPSELGKMNHVPGYFDAQFRGPFQVSAETLFAVRHICLLRDGFLRVLHVLVNSLAGYSMRLFSWLEIQELQQVQGSVRRINILRSDFQKFHGIEVLHHFSCHHFGVQYVAQEQIKGIETVIMRKGLHHGIDAIRSFHPSVSVPLREKSCFVQAFQNGGNILPNNQHMDLERIPKFVQHHVIEPRLEVGICLRVNQIVLERCGRPGPIRMIQENAMTTNIIRS
mmetsp:Transcript_25672/g.64089  ORF Transcript_25672/g.64089 Transcript_25672/m.64089 type:complete len:226 (-) Transcript_25672:1194-1871(-)